MQLISSALYVFVFFKARLYSDTSLNVIYIGLYLAGWYWWLRGGQDQGPIVIHRRNRSLALVLLTVTAIATAAEWVILVRIDDSAPFLDAFTTVSSFVALFLVARKIYENWPLWVFVNLVFVGLYVYKDLWLTALLYLIFAALSIAGWVNWTHLWRAQSSTDPVRSPLSP